MTPKPLPWTQAEAIQLCVLIEEIAPKFHAHVALTGGCLYKIKPGVRTPQPRKDVDILFYRIRQAKEIDEPGLLKALDVLMTMGPRYGWVQKATFFGKPVDLFFPESKHNDQFPMLPGDTRNPNYFDAPAPETGLFANEDLV